MFNFFRRAWNSKQSLQGDNNQQAQGNIINNLGLITTDQGLSELFRESDNKIIGRYGHPISPTSDGNHTTYKSQRLFVSLIDIGVSPVHALKIVSDIDSFIANELSAHSKSMEEEVNFSTSHIRVAVSRAILDLDALGITLDERRRLANKYARSYGNANHLVTVIYDDNRAARPIKYSYLEKIFIPELIKNLTQFGEDFGEVEVRSSIFNQPNYKHMAEEILVSVRRLGIYEIRYSTLMAIAEDLALQPPHPWLVNESNREKAFRRDVERHFSHLSTLKATSTTDLQFWRIAGECLNHGCSGILTFYGCVIGGGTNAPVNTLRNFTRLAVPGDKQNISMWEFCAISEIETFLELVEMPITNFHILLRRLQDSILNMRMDERSLVVRNLDKLSGLLNQLSETDMPEI